MWRAAKDADVVYVNEHLALLHVLAGKLRGKPVQIRIMVDGAWEIGDESPERGPLVVERIAT